MFIDETELSSDIHIECIVAMITAKLQMYFLREVPAIASLLYVTCAHYVLRYEQIIYIIKKQNLYVHRRYLEGKICVTLHWWVVC